MKIIFLSALLVANIFSEDKGSAPSIESGTAVKSETSKEILVEDAKAECKRQGKTGPELVECVAKIRKSSR